MQDIPREQIIKRFQTLPENLQNEIFSEKSANTIVKHCALRDVPDDKISIVGRLSTRVLLGYLRPELFALEIQKEAEMDMQKAQLIAHDLDMEIFSAVRLELKKLYPPTIQTPTVQSWMSQKLTQPAIPTSNLQPPISATQAKPRYVIPIPEKFLRQETRDQKPENQYGEIGLPTTNTQPQKSNITRSDLQQPANESTRLSDSKTNSHDDDLESAGGDRISQKPMETKPQEKFNLVSPGLQQQESPNTPDQTQRQISQQQTKTQQEETGTQLKANEASEANKAPSFKPIVPLPTFIQTQFRTTQVNPQKPANESGSFVANAPQDDKEKETPTSTLANDPRIKSLISKFTSSSTQKPKPPAENPYREKL